jgi:hypothetical protein
MVGRCTNATVYAFHLFMYVRSRTLCFLYDASAPPPMLQPGHGRAHHMLEVFEQQIRLDVLLFMTTTVLSALAVVHGSPGGVAS